MFLYYGGYYGGYGMRFDSSYLIYLLIALIVPMLAQGYLSSTFNQYLRVRASSGLTGADVARRILDRNGLQHVHLTEVGGRLSDHYDPSRKTVRLSRDIYHGTSIAALAVACRIAFMVHLLLQQSALLLMNVDMRFNMRMPMHHFNSVQQCFQS